ncbi:hypothetical protein QCA50_014865 [Cerrena zonata]|uniref:Uncharacterized protein n=1 Tax=Cerrena zonata TaxID=2478898 RepID=A0AAW0FWD1_9APHY
MLLTFSFRLVKGNHTKAPHSKASKDWNWKACNLSLAPVTIETASIRQSILDKPATRTRSLCVFWDLYCNVLPVMCKTIRWTVTFRASVLLVMKPKRKQQPIRHSYQIFLSIRSLTSSLQTPAS